MSKRKTSVKIIMDGSKLFEDGAKVQFSWADNVTPRLASLQIVNELCKFDDYSWLLNILRNAPQETLPEELRQ